MNQALRRFAALGMLALAAVAHPQTLTDEQAAQVIARVGDEEITAGEFARDLQFRIGQMRAYTGQEIEPDLRIRRALMNELIQERILSIAARNAGIQVAEEALEEDFQARKAIFDSEQGYQDYLKALKLTEEELKAHMRSRIRIKAFIDKETGPLSATEEEIGALYAEMRAKGELTRPTDTRDLAVILLRAKGGTDESWLAAEARAKAARERLAGGEAFEDVAREVSEDPNTAPSGGKLLEMTVGSFYPELETAMSALAVGEVSEPIRSLMGWYLLTILQENEPGVIPLEKVAPQLESQIVDGKRKEVVAGIVEDLQKMLRVELFEMDPVPSAPPESQ